MPTTTPTPVKASKTTKVQISPPPKPMDFDTFLSKLTPKDRLNVERHIAAAQEQSVPGHAKLWKRLAALMMTLAPHSAKANGQQSMQFYIADGKYRMQIFALEDLRDGKIQVYMSDAIDEAVKAGIIAKPKAGEPSDAFRLPAGAQTLSIERLDGKLTNPAPFYKDMLGWNRRAAHIVLPASATEAQAEAVEKLIIQAAEKSTPKKV